MPEMDGIEACSNLREIESLSKSMIIFLSARGEDLLKLRHSMLVLMIILTSQ